MRTLLHASIALAAVTLLACGGTAETPSPESPQAAAPAASTAEPGLTGTQWVAVSIAGLPNLEGVRSTILFDAEGRASGNAGCNSFQGSYEIEGDRLTLGPLASTRMFCEGPQQEQEDRFFAEVHRVERFEIVEGVLHLHPAGEGEPIRFTLSEESAD